ncbi:MAG TPA: lytic transglycosylase domain-containing protein [Puia sp.]|nr:lytic transglycosylase domain-containing protein [Puia sp.]
MLTRVPFRFCSIALILAVPTVPTAADLGSPSALPGKDTRSAANSPRSTIPAISKKLAISIPLADDQGMKFVRTYLRHNDEDLYFVRKRSEAPFLIIDSVLDRYGLPEELKYLAVIESDLKSSARSRVGARGPWQLMPATAHDLGLKVNRRADDRTNYYKSTVAAAKYLRDLHREFGDWLLVLAAYNGGPRPVCRAIRKSHSRSFWALQKYLPAESRGHVKKFIAVAYYFETVATTGKQLRVALNNRALATPAPAESDNDKFQRLMRESAASLRSSNELLAD